MSFTNGAINEPGTYPRTYNQNHPIALFNQPDRRGALHKIFDLILDLNDPIQHLIVDEFQDLNRAELEVIHAIEGRGAEVFVAGDDDQSIYGFREAMPAGIRQFIADFDPAEDLRLEVCFRCSEDILDLGELVANLDPRREQKEISPDPVETGKGEANLLRFGDQFDEAERIAKICRKLYDNGHDPGEILILLRSDPHGAFSSVIIDELKEKGVPVADRNVQNPLDNEEAEQVMAFLRLVENPDDSLAWRTLVQIRNNNLGPKAVQSIAERCHLEGNKFFKELKLIAASPSLLPKFGNHIEVEVTTIREKLEDFRGRMEDEESGIEEFLDEIKSVVNFLIDNDIGSDIYNILEGIVQREEIEEVGDLVRYVTSPEEKIEQELAPDRVNVITMHKAKGLTSQTVFIAGVEEERIPGRAEGREIDDERRLLYVSLTRAENRLFITFCNRRMYYQMNFGTNKEDPFRNLSRFLRDVPIHPIDGDVFCDNYIQTKGN